MKKQTLPAHIQSWLLALLSPFNAPQPGRTMEQAEAEDMVGCCSEAFFCCSYNDEDVLDLLLSGRMNAEAAKHRQEAAFYSPAWFIGQLGRYAHVKDLEARLMATLSAAGGWPACQYITEEPVSAVPSLRAVYPGLFERYDLDFLKAAEALQ